MPSPGRSCMPPFLRFTAGIRRILPSALPVHLVVGVVAEAGVGQVGTNATGLYGPAVQFQRVSSTAMPWVEILGTTTVSVKVR